MFKSVLKFSNLKYFSLTIILYTLVLTPFANAQESDAGNNPFSLPNEDAQELSPEQCYYILIKTERFLVCCYQSICEIFGSDDNENDIPEIEIDMSGATQSTPPTPQHTPITPNPRTIWR